MATIDKPPAFVFDRSAPVVLDRQNSFGDRFGNRTAFPVGVTPRNPNLVVPTPQAGTPLGISTGKPMPDHPLPPSIWGRPGNSDSSDNWFTKPQGSMLDRPSAPAVPFAPSPNPSSMGGRAGRIAALAGIDPENRKQPAPQPGGLLGLFLSSQR